MDDRDELISTVFWILSALFFLILAGVSVYEKVVDFKNDKEEKVEIELVTNQVSEYLEKDVLYLFKVKGDLHIVKDDSGKFYSASYTNSKITSIDEISSEDYIEILYVISRAEHGSNQKSETFSAPSIIQYLFSLFGR